MIKRIISYLKKKKEWNTPQLLGRLPDDPDDVMTRFVYRGERYVQMYPSGASFTEAFYNKMRPNNKKK